MRTRTAAELCELELEASLLCEVLAREPVPLGEAGGGVGAYLLFYTGRNELYRGISPSLRPIYVGSADSVTTRIRQHMDSILHVGGLEVDDFAAVVISTKGKGLAAMAEQTFVRAFEPAWNATRFRGFGCKDQGRTRAKNQIPSSWDKLHPGRPWALTSRRDTELEADIREYVRAQAPIPPWARYSSGRRRTATPVALGATNDDYRFFATASGLAVVTREYLLESA